MHEPQHDQENEPTMKNPLISPLYYENHPIANRRLNEAFDCGFAAARRRLLVWNAAMAVLVLVLLGLVAGRRAHAQTSGPIQTPQLNNDLFVGQIGYPTIQSAVSRACNMTGMGYRVVIPAGATPADTPAQVTGCAKVLVNDQRSAPSSNYSWNATTSAYQLQSATFTGGTVTQQITLPFNPLLPLQTATKQYVDANTIPPYPASVAAAVKYIPLPNTALASLPLQQIAYSNIQAVKLAFSDGAPYYTAAPLYTYAYISDTSLAMLGTPQYFSATDVLSNLQHFVAARSTSSAYPTVPAGSIPIAINQNGTVNGVSNLGNPYCAGYDSWCHHPTAEGIFSLVHLEKLYFDKTGSTAQVASDSSIIDAALSAIPRDATTQIPYVTPGDEWVCFGFQEDIRFTGLLGTCAMQNYQVDIEAATLFGAAGLTSLQAKYSSQAATILASLGTSSPLWDAADGMFYGGTIQDRQIDTTASVLAVQYGIATAAQRTAISAYLSSNAATVFLNGYMKQSNMDFATVGALLTSGGPPYNATDPRDGSGCYQRGGFWSHMNRGAIEALNVSFPAAAKAYLQAFQTNNDPTMEYYSPNCVNGGPQHGFTNNLESPVGDAFAANEFPALPAPASALPQVAMNLTVTGTNSDGEGVAIKNPSASGVAAMVTYDANGGGSGGFGYANSGMSLTFLQSKQYLYGNTHPLCMFATFAPASCGVLISATDNSATFTSAGTGAGVTIQNTNVNGPNALVFTDSTNTGRGGSGYLNSGISNALLSGKFYSYGNGVPYCLLANLSLSGCNLLLLTDGSTVAGGGSFAYATGSAAAFSLFLDNGTTDTPNLTFRYGPNLNFSQDSGNNPGGFPNLVGQVHRFIHNNGETSGAVLGGIDGTGNAGFVSSMYAPLYWGPATAPSGSCTAKGAWAASQDGHLTYCNSSGTWTTKI